ncbi:hypothetical protein CROQUDRAFT_265733 [Cronartium quercuum f. sp. fusiforme G11]|uniref:Uncharacterized protein n=1 Tax=Cronartium quercuum f. sp. fusiforme G11 TaxID=708437 RepID=A0A9P6NCY3_9BASI|nr:hypothetical protein CROQUDRAFT_265733 [Cronartium quercuum f. sp. fusiforme G11]
MASPHSIDLSAGLRDMIDSLKLPINTIQKHNNTSVKSGVRLDVDACYSQLKKSTSDGAEDVVMREALELYCSLMSPPSTPLRAAPQEHRQNLQCVDSEDQYCSMSIYTSYTLPSASPHKADFSPPPSNTSSLSYPRDLTYSMSSAPFEHGTSDIEELDGRFAGQSATSSVSKSWRFSCSYPSQPSALFTVKTNINEYIPSSQGCFDGIRLV